MEATELISRAVKAFAPPPDLTTSEWADEYRHVASGPFPGKWRTDRAPQSREPMDATSDPSIEGLVVVKPTRSAGTEIVNNLIGRRIHLDPCDILYVQSTDEISGKYSNEVLMKRVISPTPVLRERISNKIRGRKATETIDRKNYPGGTLHMVGAKSPHKFTMVDYKVVIFDDVAKYEKIKSGDPLELGIGRTKGIWDRLIVMVSNPGEDGKCPMQPYFEMTDQRHRYVPCSRCGGFQVLKFGGPDTRYGIKWSKDAEDVWYECEHCHGRIDEHEKAQMDIDGEWRPHNPEASPRWRGYKLNPFLVTWQPWKTEIVDRWLAARHAEHFDLNKVKTFVTERLGDWYKPKERDKVPYQEILDRRENYPADVPRGTLVITIGADVQGDRIEAEAVGWGRDFENWTIEKKVFYGNPVEKEVWEDLDRFLLKTWKHESGMDMSCSRAFIDSGDGNLTQKVYDFTTPREVRGVFSSKGENQRGKAVFSRWTMVNNKQTKLAYVGTDSAKDLIHSWLALKEPGPGYSHFPITSEDEDIKQLLSEYKTDEGKWEQKKGQRNEGLDIRVYSLAALMSLKPAWDELEQNMGADTYAYRVFGGYDPTRHLSPVEMDSKRPVELCVSFDRDVCTWVMLQQEGKDVKVFDEITMRGADTVRMGKVLRRKYANEIKEGLQVSVYGPEADRSEYALLGELGFRQQRINRKSDIRANMNAVAALLENESISLTIHPRCLMLRKDLEMCAWREDGVDIERASGRGSAVTSLGAYVGLEYPLRRAKPNPKRRHWK